MRSIAFPIMAFGVCLGAPVQARDRRPTHDRQVEGVLYQDNKAMSEEWYLMPGQGLPIRVDLSGVDDPTVGPVQLRGDWREDVFVADAVAERAPIVQTVEGFLKMPGLGYDSGAPGYRLINTDGEREIDIVATYLNQNVAALEGLYLRAELQLNVSTAFYESSGHRMERSWQATALALTTPPENLIRLEGVLYRDNGPLMLIHPNGRVFTLQSDPSEDAPIQTPGFVVGQLAEDGQSTLTVFDIEYADSLSRTVRGVLRAPKRRAAPVQPGWSIGSQFADVSPLRQEDLAPLVGAPVEATAVPFVVESDESLSLEWRIVDIEALD